jgi:ribosomal protein L13
LCAVLGRLAYDVATALFRKRNRHLRPNHISYLG